MGKSEGQDRISRLLLSWYQANKRSLPWRDNPEPYRVWVAEVMLQQTQVVRVLPYFDRWMARFPDVQTLAQADLQDVLRLWEGLGYYARARNLHRAARILQADHEGRIPESPESLQKLPGIGPYTAGAIASIAFGRSVPVVDANVRRVLARLFNVEIPVDTADGRRRVNQLAAHILPSSQAGDHNQALMELGAMVCSARRPVCRDCPLAGDCQSRLLAVELERPVLSVRAAVPHYIVAAAVMHWNGAVLITKRPENGLLGGMWEFPGGKVEAGENLRDCLHREIEEELGVGLEIIEKIGQYNHTYTHFKVLLHAFACRMAGSGRTIKEVGVEAHRWVRPAHLGDYPMGKIDRMISRDIQEDLV